jgi:hypothetical protein
MFCKIHKTPRDGSSRQISPALITLLAFIVLTPTLHADVKPAFASEVTITIENGTRIIRSNGIPNHLTGEFPNRGNPNTIAPQKYEFRMPADPKPAEHTTPLRMQPFGVAINGVVFDPGAAEWWNRDRSSGWQYEPLFGNGMLGVDKSHAHVQPTGAYHYHGLPTALIYALTDGKPRMVLLGWAADGFPIYNPIGYADPNNAGSAQKSLKSSYAVKHGTRPNGPGGAYDGRFVADYEYVAGSGDLDECNGIFGVTPEYPKGIYHYVLTDTFPFVPRMYRGTPDKSFATHGGPGRGGPGGPGRRLPLPLIVKALDADGDGILSATEIANAPAVLAGLDKNGDGKLTWDEYMGPPPNGRGPRGEGAGADGRPGPGADGRRPPIPRIVRALDINTDGIIDAQEIKNAAESLKKLDDRGDGQLTPDEYLGPRPDGPDPRGRPGDGPGAGIPPQDGSSRLKLSDRPPGEN